MRSVNNHNYFIFGHKGIGTLFLTSIVFITAMLIPTDASARLCFWCKNLSPMSCSLDLMEAADTVCNFELSKLEDNGGIISGNDAVAAINANGIIIRGNPETRGSIYFIHLTSKGLVTAKGLSAKGRQMSTRGTWRNNDGTVMVTFGRGNPELPLVMYHKKTEKPRIPIPKRQAVEEFNTSRSNVE